MGSWLKCAGCGICPAAVALEPCGHCVCDELDCPWHDAVASHSTARGTTLDCPGHDAFTCPSCHVGVTSRVKLFLVQGLSPLPQPQGLVLPVGETNAGAETSQETGKEEKCVAVVGGSEAGRGLLELLNCMLDGSFRLGACFSRLLFVKLS